MYGSPLFLRIVLCASAAISKECLINFRSPGFNLFLSALNKARYSRRISFFSCSSFKLYLGADATVSIHHEFTEKILGPPCVSIGEQRCTAKGLKSLSIDVL